MDGDPAVGLLERQVDGAGRAVEGSGLLGGGFVAGVVVEPGGVDEVVEAHRAAIGGRQGVVDGDGEGDGPGGARREGADLQGAGGAGGAGGRGAGPAGVGGGGGEGGVVGDGLLEHRAGGVLVAGVAEGQGVDEEVAGAGDGVAVALGEGELGRRVDRGGLLVGVVVTAAVAQGGAVGELLDPGGEGGVDGDREGGRARGAGREGCRGRACRRCPGCPAEGAQVQAGSEAAGAKVVCSGTVSSRTTPVASRSPWLAKASR